MIIVDLDLEEVDFNKEGTHSSYNDLSEDNT